MIHGARPPPAPTLSSLRGAALAASGCAGAMIGAGGATGYAVVQERSLGNAVDDTSIKFRINERLMSHDQRLWTKANLDVVEGRVLITGVVPAVADRDKATDLAWEVRGVREVLNELQVAPAGDAESFVRDASITAQLRFKVLTDRDIVAINFTITTVNGIVYLLGIARSDAEHRRLVDHARNVGGVAKVVSHVLVTDDPRRKA
ncbi:MAG: BON domain-containing protein [Alphaproteobacteria bacterium]|nr:BON domain-containing protein [Alphaproteobacteria bacterium]